MSNDWAEFMKRVHFWNALGASLPPDARTVPSKQVGDALLDMEESDYEAQAILRFNEVGLQCVPEEMVKHFAAALAIKGGCVIYRFANETVIGNLERVP